MEEWFFLMDADNNCFHGSEVRLLRLAEAWCLDFAATSAFAECNFNIDQIMPSALHENVFSILENPVTALAAGIIIGLAIGRITAPSSRQHPRATTSTSAKSISKRKLKGSTENESSDDESGHSEELQDFTNISEECKLVLVVRTDLGMGKGTLQIKLSMVDECANTILLYRQDSCAMLACDSGLLQSSPQA